MKKIIVKLSFEWDKRQVETQTPNNSTEWSKCKFHINKKIKKCDYWVVYGTAKKSETVICPKENTLLISNEPPCFLQYKKSFTDQFANIISCHEYIQHKNNILYQQGLPWFVGKNYKKDTCIDVNKNYNQLFSQKQPRKNKLISVISSSNVFTTEYKARSNFITQLKDYFGDKIDVFGKGIKEVADKWDILAPYKYHIALENSSYKDYWTEKLSDTFLSFCYPIYYGCPNIEKYFDKEMLTQIDIKNPDKAISIIEKTIANKTFEISQEKILDARNKCLKQYNLFALIADYIEKKESSDSNKKNIFHKVCIKQITPSGVTPIIDGNIKGISLNERKKTIEKILPKIDELGKKQLISHYYKSLKSLDYGVVWKEERRYVDRLFDILPKTSKKEILILYLKAIFWCKDQELPTTKEKLDYVKKTVEDFIVQFPDTYNNILKRYYHVYRILGLKGKLLFIKDFGLKNYLKIKTQ